MQQFSRSDYDKLLQEYQGYKDMGLKLDMSRGKPSKAQLDISNGLLDVLNSSSNLMGNIDYRNYGDLDGIPEAKALFAELAGVETNEISIFGNSSLNIMYDTFQRAMQFGVLGGVPFNKQGKIKWLCPVPGYDRHFAICELFGVEMINIPTDNNGPDMDMVEKLVSSDESIKGIWCVPKYSNPEGIVYSDEVVDRFAHLKPKAKDFRIYWDNAYMVHYVSEEVKLKNLYNTAKACGNEDIVYMFGSTSKITFGGGGVAFMVASEKNLKAIIALMSKQTIGYDKINQLAHVRFFKNKEGVMNQMAKHAELMKPKFEAVLNILGEELTDLATWVNPKGGYFVSCNLPVGTAKRTIALAKEAGVKFTDAGATYPYHNDPNDSNVRIAPSFPPVEELVIAMKVFCCAAKIAYCEKIFNK